ncbi:hypothetical protein [Deinococcus hopiensis]|uniref:hypothetical protein n=1 Tax=Deinococcus hopiensis TaxID=309885 RepID=UPI001FE365E6|nr:hypothetical protein [Deinococcus hopiensis]
MSISPALLLDRLIALGCSLEESGHALALIGLGSVGSELGRLDAHSDLDFFVVAEEGRAAHYLRDLTWLARPAALVYTFRNTPDGYKVLYVDGVYAEFAVFTPTQLAGVPLVNGRVVWSRPGVSTDFGREHGALPTTGERPSREHRVGEALTNLLVGLKRYCRGERLSAFRFVQGYALSQVLALAAERDGPSAGADLFDAERRYEARHPAVAAHLTDFLPGYDETPRAAQALLTYLEKHEEVSPALAQAIRALM